MKSTYLLLVLLAVLLPATISSVQAQACYGSSPDIVQMREMFKTLDPVTKTQIWQAQMKRALETRSLTQVKRDVIFRAAKFLTPEIYRTDTASKAFKASAAGKESVALRKAMRDEFSMREGSEIFERLDPVIFSEYTGGKLVSKIKLVSYNPTSVNPFEPHDCSCSTYWTWCDVGSCSTRCPRCRDCIPVINCGPFSAFQCDGDCSYITEEEM